MLTWCYPSVTYVLPLCFLCVTLVHYCEELMGAVVFAKVQGQVKFRSPRTRRVRGLSDFASPQTFVKTTTPINFCSNNIPAKNMILDGSENSWMVMSSTPQIVNK